MMQAPIQATRRPAAGPRGRRQDTGRRDVAILLLVLLVGNLGQFLWHQAYAEDAEKAMGILRDRAYQAEQDKIEAERRLADWQADYMRQLPQD